MPIDPENLTQLKKLAAAIEWSRERLKPYRENRTDAIREFVGAHYGEDGADDKVPVNLLELAITIYRLQLSARMPSVLITTPRPHLKPYAEILRLAATNLIKYDIPFESSHQDCVTDALFLMGVMKVGASVRPFSEMRNDGYGIAKPYADPVDLDDWVMDMTGQRYRNAQYSGNRYRVSYEQFMEMEEYENKDDLHSSDEDDMIDEGGVEKTQAVGIGTEIQEGEYQKHINLWDIWLPDEKLILTVLDRDKSHVVKIEEWKGPSHGPYRVLMFSDVPANIMPSAPVHHWTDLHLLANRIFRKLGRQADRQKDITGVQGGADADGNRVLNANDGDMISMDNPKGIAQFKTGGIDQVSLAFFLQLRDLFSYMGGNLDAIGGLSPQSETLGQDRLLTESASRRMADMQSRTVRFTEELVRDLTWYLWADPLVDIPLVQTIPGTDIEIPLRFTPEMKWGRFLDYNFSIRPYSMQHRTPATQLQSISQVFQQFILPLLPMMEAQGISINLPSLLHLVARYLDMDELEDILTFATPHTEIGQRQQASGSRSPVTHRINERVNRPGMTRHGRDDAMSRLLMGGGLQGAEMSGLMRPTR